MNRKNTKIKPSYIVDIDNITCLEDIPSAYAIAKQEAGMPLTDDELIAICKRVYDELGPKITIVDVTECTCCKKKPWYKRFWNWLTCK